MKITKITVLAVISSFLIGCNNVAGQSQASEQSKTISSEEQKSESSLVNSSFSSVNSVSSSLSSFSSSEMASSSESISSSEETEKYYHVQWMNRDDEIGDGNVFEGEIPEYCGDIPRSYGDGDAFFVFDHWDPEPAPIYSDTTFQAVFVNVLERWPTESLNAALTNLSRYDYDLDFGAMAYEGVYGYELEITDTSVKIDFLGLSYEEGIGAYKNHSFFGNNFSYNVNPALIDGKSVFIFSGIWFYYTKSEKNDCFQLTFFKAGGAEWCGSEINNLMITGMWGVPTYCVPMIRDVRITSFSCSMNESKDKITINCEGIPSKDVGLVFEAYANGDLSNKYTLDTSIVSENPAYVYANKAFYLTYTVTNDVLQLVAVKMNQSA